MILKKFTFLVLFFILFSKHIKADDFDDLIDEATTTADAWKPVVHQQKEITYIDVLKSLLGFKINDVLAKDFYKKTHTVIKRPVLTLPIFNLYHTDHICQDWLFRFFLFGNMTGRANYTDNSPFIQSFIAVGDKEIVDIIKDITNINPKAFELIKNTKKQERKAGIMFQSLINFNDISLEIDLPLFYEERNYFFTQREKEEIESLFGKPEKEQEKELNKLAVADKFGIGDARIKVGISTITKSNIFVKAGIQSTLPISFAFKKGLIGSNFKKFTQDPLPPFDFKKIFELVNAKKESQIATDMKEFGFAALNRLSAIVLDDGLGNDGHFGLGIFIEPQIKIHEGVSLKALGSLEYFFSAKEQRYFLIKKNKNAFAESTLQKDLDNEEDAKKAVLFLDQAVLETIFPSVLTTEITPGFIGQVTIGPQFKLNEWNLFFGYDFWFQNKEKIGDITCKNAHKYKVEKGIKGCAFTSKLFATLSYTKLKPCNDWSFNVSFEEALASSGVGKDFSVCAGFEFNY